MIRTTKAGTHQADIYHKGKRYRRSFESKAQAERWEAEARLAIAMGRTPEMGMSSPMGATTMMQLAESVYETRWKEAAAEESLWKNAKDCVEFLGEDRRVETVTTQDIDAMVRAWRDRGLSTSTCNRKLSALSAMFTHAFQRGWLSRKPHIPKMREAEHRSRVITPAEEESLLTRLDWLGRADERDATLTLLDTGMRLSEALMRPYADWDGDGWLRVAGTKNRKPRSIPLTPRVREVFARRRKANPEDTLIFQNLNQHRYERTWALARNALGKDNDREWVPHILRHTFCSRLAQRGVPLQVIRDLAGHTSLSTTLRYAHLAPANLVEAVAKLSQGHSPTASAIVSPVTAVVTPP